ncbi:MAG: hypothetical protein GX091_10490 [Peptococcaceae bacterium]|nr:hypothetical protein [Peptococcaceae bacterium]
MKYRHKKIKREHSIIKGALDWLEDLSRNRDVTDIIPGVIDVTHSKEKGVFFQYETSSGCKLLVKNGGSIQEVFVVTSKPQTVREWAAKIREELDLIQSTLDKQQPVEKDDAEPSKTGKPELSKAKPKKPALNQRKDCNSAQFEEKAFRGLLPVGVREDYQLVEINKALRDSFVDSLATMADLDKPKLEDILDRTTLEALKKYKKSVEKKEVK